MASKAFHYQLRAYLLQRANRSVNLLNVSFQSKTNNGLIVLTVVKLLCNRTKLSVTINNCADFIKHVKWNFKLQLSRLAKL